uniref:Ig-like domain-containing protein n=1 Tax=Accipiter nisus TaxID=211598 RepID=A0A8B9P0Y5_9AVES
HTLKTFLLPHPPPRTTVSPLVTWTADGRTLSSGVETSQPQRQTNNQYMASSYLTLSAADWKSHETYACKVTHETGTIKKVLTRSECS